MSRSYKKAVAWCDSRPYMKRKFNRAFRRNTFDFPNGKMYRKQYCSYDISDRKFIYFGSRKAVVIWLMKRQSRWVDPMTKEEAEKEYRQMRAK